MHSIGVKAVCYTCRGNWVKINQWKQLLSYRYP